MPSDQSKSLFEYNMKVWKIFGIWSGDTPWKRYKYYSMSYLFVTFIIYNLLLTLNLIYTPRTIELILREVIFSFTEITVATKILTILLLRGKIFEAFDIIDSDEFVGDYYSKDGFLSKVHKNFKLGWKSYAVMSNVAYSSQVFVPIFLNLIRGTESELPVCKYYFLSDENRRSYYFFWFIYQSFGMYGHMMYNVFIDSFIAGLLIVSIAQMRILNVNLKTFSMSEQEKELPKELQDQIAIAKLNSYLRHYDSILKYNKIIQEILSVTIFFQFSVTTIIICVVMCGLLMSEELVLAAYSTEWISRSEPFKQSLKIFMERTKTPIMITGLNMFPLSLLTFTSIMKSAYSFFTLIRNFQEE
ncbi:uncharacterized protein LOC142972612 isoform X2 [Anticarsia gemmatalis]|uniref:uncharacterized protein LOC142972612 isoform X2 n=1 Tax=Anticarsia gemmatalis TaxID=129554 RepID=UPI003F766EAA